jgi:hypothetical protein
MTRRTPQTVVMMPSFKRLLCKSVSQIESRIVSFAGSMSRSLVTQHVSRTLTFLQLSFVFVPLTVFVCHFQFAVVTATPRHPIQMTGSA